MKQKGKKLKLKPSQRKSRRYLVFSKNISKEKIKNSILDYIGILGYSKANPYFIQKNNKLILAVNRKEVEKIKAGLILSEIKVLKVSGTIAGLER